MSDNKKQKLTKKQKKEITAGGKRAVKRIKKFSKMQKIVFCLFVILLIAAIAVVSVYYKDTILDWFQQMTSQNDGTPPADLPENENGDAVGDGTPTADGRFAMDGYYGSQNYGDPVTLKDSPVQLFFINVGQGSALFVIFSDGTTLLADAGNTAATGYIDKKAAEKNLIDLLVSLNLTDIDYVLATHPDADHVNLMLSVYARFQVNTTIYNDIPAAGTTKTYNNFRTKALEEPNSRQMKIGETGFLEDYDADGSKTTETIVGGATSITLYAPGYNNTAAGFKNYKNDKNSMSPICILQYGARRVLFTGDSTTDTEEWFLRLTSGKPAANFDVDILFVGHHGSNTSSSQAFLNAIQAEYAVISAGAGNSYKHPVASTMEKLRTAGTVTYRTDTHGTITLKIASDNNFGFLTQTAGFTFNNSKAISDRRLAA